MDDFESTDKANWNKEMLHIFCDIRIKAIDMGMRPNTHFDRCGWKFILTSFKEQTGHAFTKPQLKNKWDVCKKDWRIWTKLIGETDVGWSNELGTIMASDEWWKSKIQENRGAKKFRQSGIEPSLKFKFDRMFSGVTATGQHAWAPSSGTVGGTEDNLGTLNISLEGVDLEEGRGDSEENVDINFENYNSRDVGGEPISRSSNTKSIEKRKEREHPEPRARKKKSSGIGVQLVSIQKQLLDSMSSRSDSTSANRDLPGCSIPEVMAEFQSIHGSTDDENFFFLATKFLQGRRNREMWASINGILKVTMTMLWIVLLSTLTMVLMKETVAHTLMMEFTTMTMMTTTVTMTMTMMQILYGGNLMSKN